jgi:ABC-2 type transport system permease protein
MKNSDFAGTGTLFWLFLHRDRFLLLLWIFLPVILGLTVAATFTAMADQGMQRVLTEFNNDPLVSAVLGPVMSLTFQELLYGEALHNSLLFWGSAACLP